jgi:hypothetical protein
MYAIHSTAVNPGTVGIAEYKELSTCSDGNLWQASHADEIGRIFQGLGPDSYMPTGTNTLFFIDKKDIPKNKKPTYVRVVCAGRPEKTHPSESVGQLVATRLNTLATSPPKPPTSKLPNACSTVLSAPPMADS